MIENFTLNTFLVALHPTADIEARKIVEEIIPNDEEFAKCKDEKEILALLNRRYGIVSDWTRVKVMNLEEYSLLCNDCEDTFLENFFIGFLNTKIAKRTIMDVIDFYNDENYIITLNDEPIKTCNVSHDKIVFEIVRESVAGLHPDQLTCERDTPLVWDENEGYYVFQCLDFEQKNRFISVKAFSLVDDTVALFGGKKVLDITYSFLIVEERIDNPMVIHKTFASEDEAIVAFIKEMKDRGIEATNEDVDSKFYHFEDGTRIYILENKANSDNL